MCVQLMGEASSKWKVPCPTSGRLFSDLYVSVCHHSNEKMQNSNQLKCSVSVTTVKPLLKCVLFFDATLFSLLFPKRTCVILLRLCVILGVSEVTAVLELHTQQSCVCLWALSEDGTKRHRATHTSVSLQFRIIPISIFITRKVKY